jgi:hypothetical protein
MQDQADSTVFPASEKQTETETAAGKQTVKVKETLVRREKATERVTGAKLVAVA